MARIQYEAVAFTATSSGAIATYSTKTYNGFVEAIGYVPTTASTGLTPTTAGNITLTAEFSQRTIFNLTDISDTGAIARLWFPRVGTVLTTAAATASTGNGRVPLINERILITVTSGSTDTVTKTGTLRFYIE